MEDNRTSANAATKTMQIIPLPCYLNGQFSDLARAQVSVMDRGFIFGDGIYEVVPAYGGRPFRFAQHMARLERSLQEVRIPNPLSREGWLAIVQKLIEQYAQSVGASSDSTDQLVYMQITRGVAMRDHTMLSGLQPTVFITTNLMTPPSTEQRAGGVTCVSAEDFRWEKAHIKSTSLLGAVFARQISADVQAAETVMFRRGFLSEAAASNVWVVKGGAVIGPPKDHLVLEGIRYGLIEELCQASAIRFELRRITRDEVFDADELLLSSATKEVLPITKLDQQAVGHGPLQGRPGPVYEKLYAAYQRAKASP